MLFLLLFDGRSSGLFHRDGHSEFLKHIDEHDCRAVYAAVEHRAGPIENHGLDLSLVGAMRAPLVLLVLPHVRVPDAEARVAVAAEVLREPAARSKLCDGHATHAVRGVRARAGLAGTRRVHASHQGSQWSQWTQAERSRRRRAQCIHSMTERPQSHTAALLARKQSGAQSVQSLAATRRTHSAGPAAAAGNAADLA